MGIDKSTFSVGVVLCVVVRSTCSVDVVLCVVVGSNCSVDVLVGVVVSSTCSADVTKVLFLVLSAVIAAFLHCCLRKYEGLQLLWV